MDVQIDAAQADLVEATDLNTPVNTVPFTDASLSGWGWGAIAFTGSDIPHRSHIRRVVRFDVLETSAIRFGVQGLIAPGEQLDLRGLITEVCSWDLESDGGA
jgi:hypothetical protein